MLKKLRKKFILTNMILVGIVLILVFVLVCANSYRQQKADIESVLFQSIKKVTINGNDQQPRLDKPNNNNDVSKYYFGPIVTVLADDSGSILYTYDTGASMDSDQLKIAVKEALAGQKDFDALSDHNLFYARNSSFLGTKISFTQSTYFYSSFRKTILLALLLFVLSMMIIFIISLAMSKQALDPVKKAWGQQQQFVADASHELKTPLTVILANNNILAAHGSDTVESQQKWVNSTETEANHMRKLVDDLLFLAKSDASPDDRLSFGLLNLSELVWNCSLQFEPVAFEKGITLNSDIDQNIEMEGNSTQLNQLLRILLDNGFKYSIENSTMELLLKQSAGGIKLTVTNSGQPIPKEDIPHIFERFYRSDKARTQDGGYGLGLAIAKSIAEKHNGRLTVISTDEKTTFTFFIPTQKTQKNQKLQSPKQKKLLSFH